MNDDACRDMLGNWLSGEGGISRRVQPREKTAEDRRINGMASTVSGSRSRVLGDNLRRIRETIGDRPVRLVAVSKTKPLEDILLAYEHGQRVFGENYVQELLDKASKAPLDIEWHFIGGLQSNKCRLLARIPNLFVETIDSVKKADAMNKAWNHSHPLKIFLQVNTSGEEAKGGMAPEDCPSVALHIQSNCPKLSLQGVMTIGAFDRDPSLPNPDFISLAQVGQTLAFSLGKPMELSMGMSGDFEQAIQAGSTNIRVGSSLFGERDYSAKS